MLDIPKGTFCGGDCTILSGRVGLEFEDGTQADVSKGVYIHHILSSNKRKMINPFVTRCDTQGDIKSVSRPAQVSAGFAGVSDDNGNEPIVYGTKDGTIEGGYWLSKEDSIGAWADIVNLDTTEKKVYVTYELEYLPGHVGSDSQGTLISVTGCLARKINTPASGPANTTSGKFRFFSDGYLVNGSKWRLMTENFIVNDSVNIKMIEGHLHDGGVAVDLYINSKYTCTSNAVYGGESGTTVQNGKKWETISGMTLCPGPIKIKDGDYMSLTARYDLTQHPLYDDTSTNTMR
jgi:hypothetical protein